MKRIEKGEEVSEHYNSPEEYDAFYEALKSGALPTTVAINPSEMQQHFEDILSKEKHGDIIHIPLSSGLSVTCDNAVKVAAEMNAKLKGRKIYVVDSLVASLGMGMLVEELITLRDKGVAADQAVKRIEKLRDHMQTWIIVDDLFHLKRGGRISGFKATLGTFLGIKPIIVVNNKGKLVIENRMRGSKNAIEYVLGKMEKMNTDTVYFARTSKSKLFHEFHAAIMEKFPNMKIKNGIVGPIIGSHLGCGAVVFFEGEKRLDIHE